MLHPLVDLLVPSRCDGCGVVAPPPWCDPCERAALGPAEPCWRCAGPDRPGHGCWSDGAPVSATVAVVRWRGPVAAALARAKLAGRSEVHAAAGARLGRAVARAHHRGGVPAIAAVVPVPTDRRRARRRGADHTAVLAAGAGAALGVPAWRALRGVGRLPDRTSAGAARATVPLGTFVPGPDAARVRGVPVLLVDDVLTTGATAVAAAAALTAAGSGAVVVGVVARAGAHTLVDASTAPSGAGGPARADRGLRPR